MKYITILLLFVSLLFSDIEKNNNSIFSTEELDWIKNNPKIKVGVDSNWPPFDYIDITGQHQGISSEYLNIVSKFTGLKFEIYADAWVNVLDKIQKEELDMLACAAKTSNRDNYLNFTKPYLNVEVVVVGRKNLKINNFDDIKNYTVAVQKSNYIHEDLARKFPNMKFYFAKSNEDAFDAVNFGKADFYLGNLAVVNYFFEKNLLSNLEIKMKSDFESAELSIAVLKQKDILFNIIQKVLNNISDEEKNQINRKWIFHDKSEQKINFSKEELSWLNENPIIYLAGNPKWPPFSYNEDGKYIGIVPDMLKLLKEVSGINFQHFDTKDWQESVELLKNKQIKMLDAVAITPSMSKILDFTPKYFSSQIVIIGNKNNQRYISSIKDLENIKDKSLGLVEGHFITEMIKRDNPDLEIFGTFKDIPEALKALSSGMIDYFILDIPSFDYYSKYYSLSNLKIVGITGYNAEYRFGIEKNNQILLSIMNKILKQIPQDKKDFIYRKWIKIDNSKNIDYDLVWKLAVIFVIFFGIIFFWNRKLQEEIREKEKVQKELEEEKTHIKALNDELEKAKEIAENIAKQKSEFLANMSHEIRTPMNSVIGFTEILDKELTNPLHKEYLTSIKNGGNALLRIINDILDLSKIEAGKLEIKQESINPTNLFIEIESIFHSKIISKNINFILEIDKTIPKYIIIDGVRIRQILFNLIGNAIKFTEKGHIKLKVENVYKDNVKSKIDLIFSIEDTGIGIDEDNLESIFNAFEQASNQNVAKYGGTGLGLAICAKLVQMMNGEISVQSQRTKGSTFKVILKDIPVSAIEESIEVKSKVSSSNIVFEKSQILVVDDVEENRKLVQASLKDFDIDLIMAENGKEALERLKNINVDLILMDLRMPVMDGYEATTIIKKDERLKNIPLIALTASVMGKDLEKVEEYGFDGYLRKPVILDDLIEELGKFLKYFFINEEIREKEDNNEIDLKNLKIVIELLEDNLKNEWKAIKDGGDFSLIEEFAQKLNEVSIRNSIFILKDYSKELLKNIEAFDIEKVDYLMNSYLELIENLKAKLGN